MKLPGAFWTLGVLSVVHPTYAEVTGGGGLPSTIRAGVSRFAEEDVSDVGGRLMHAIAPEEEEVGEDIIERLEADGQTTGESLCPRCPCRECKRYPQPAGTYGGSN